MKDYASEINACGQVKDSLGFANLHHPLIMHVPKAQKLCKTINKSETQICI
jgi:hypothetical protein